MAIFACQVAGIFLCLSGENPGKFLVVFLIFLSLFTICFVKLRFHLIFVLIPVFFLLGYSQTYYHNTNDIKVLSSECFNNGISVTLIGTVDDVKESQYGKRYFLKDCYVYRNGIKKLTEGVIIKTGPDEKTDAKRYDRLKVETVLEYIPKAENPGQVDYCEYYGSIGIRYQGKLSSTQSDIAVIECNNPVLRFANSVRESIQTVYENVCDEIDLGVYSAMLLADKTYLDLDIKELFSDTGIGHILAISGLHISIIGMGLYKFLRRFGIHYAVSGIVCGGLIIFYGFITGNPVSAMRAIIMFVCGVYANIIGRAYDMLSATSFAGIILLMINPYYVKNCGFLLSFMAILGISCVNAAMPKTESKLITAFLGTVSIMLSTLPITLWFYYRIPTYSFVLNLIVIPLLALVMVSACLVAALGQFTRLGAILSLGPGHYLLLFFRKLSETVLNLPYSILTFGRPDIYRVVVYYLLLFCFCIRNDIKIKRIEMLEEKIRDRVRGVINAGGIIILSVSVIVITGHSHSELRITFLSVGQGDASVIEFPSGDVAFVDGGSSSRDNIFDEIIMPFLNYRGIRQVDYLFLSHDDIDHYNAWVNADIMVSNLVLNEIDYGNFVSDKKGGILEVADRIKNHGGTVRTFGYGDFLKEKNVELICLSGRKDFEYDRDSYNSENDDSLVLLLKGNGITVLFTGDISEKQESAVVSRLINICETVDFLKVAHHGSRFSTGNEFLEAMNISYGIISCGKNNSYGHPHKETMERLSEYGVHTLRTDYNGAITICSQKGKNTIRSSLE